jgi:hypothetical protein
MRPVAWVLVGCGAVVLAGASCVAGVLGLETFDDTVRGRSGEIVEAGDLGVMSIRTGDCVDLPDQTPGWISSVDGVPCEKPHDGQVFAEFDVEGGSYPGEDEMIRQAVAGCDDRWPAMIDGEWGFDGVFDLAIIYPRWSSWQLGDREVSCIVIRLDGGEISGDLL